jgi:S1-C subfamily serine protease
MTSRRWQAPLYLVVGLVLGGLLPWPSRETPRRDPDWLELTPAAGRNEGKPGGLSMPDHARGAGPEANADRPSFDSQRALPRPGRVPAPISPSAVAERALASTVFIRVGSTYGAGILLGPSGLVLTCAHVIADESPIEVEFSGGARAVARPIDRDLKLDLALLEISGQHAPAPRIGSIANVSIGDEVFAMGAPRRMAFSLHRGMVSFVGRDFDGVRYLQTDLPANAGNSGGPVINDRGEIIAVMSFILRESEGIAFALPIDYALERFGARLGSRGTKKSANPASTSVSKSGTDSRPMY